MGTSDDQESAAAELRARRASSFGPEAAAYAEHRPDYPLAGIRWALESIEGTPAVLDLGAGTGKLTEGLVAAGAEVTAVEPDEGMRAEFAHRHPAVTLLAGSAETIPLPDHSVDAVVAGQAMHWFDLDRAFPEIARVLRPGGVVAAFWNTEDPTVEWVVGLNRIARSSVSSANALGPLPSHPLFEHFERRDFPHSHRRTAESLAATIGTHSHTLVISAQERAAVLDRIVEYLRGRPETGNGEFDLPMRTMVLRSRLR